MRRAFAIPCSASAGREALELELRALRALRRVGSKGMLHANLIQRMRPSRRPAIRAVIDQLSREAKIEHLKSVAFGGRLQGAWRITERGRVFVDQQDLPPAA